MVNAKISVIIVSYKNLKVIIECLDSIYKHNDIGNLLEVIVIDNSPEDNIYDYIRENYPNVILVHNENRGFGQANNIGAKLSKGKYLLFLNPDTILIESVFKFAIYKFEQDINLAQFGVKLVDRDYNKRMSFFVIDKHGLINKICNKFNLFIDGKMFICGADIFITKDIFINCGMFDENIFMYNEEADLTRRVKCLKKKTSYFKNKSIIHLEGKTTINNKIAIEQRMKSQRYYCDKYNVSYKNKLNSEIRYTYIKMVIYKFLLRKEKSDVCKNNIGILKEFS